MSAGAGRRTWAIAKTAAGPTTCHADPASTIGRSLRSGSRRRPTVAAPASPHSTATGTSCGGRTKSITTCTGVVGSAEPGPISNSTEAATMYTAMHAANEPIVQVEGGASAFHAATPSRNEPPVMSPDHRSLPRTSSRMRRRASRTTATSAVIARMISISFSGDRARFVSSGSTTGSAPSTRAEVASRAVERFIDWSRS